MPAGRPTEFDPIYCEKVIEFMAEGLSFEAFAGEISVSKQTLYNWLKAHPEFMDAKSIADMKCRNFWERQGIDGLFSETTYEKGPDGTSTSHTRSIVAPVWIFNMKNRFKWRDKQPDEEPTAPAGEVAPKLVTSAEWLEVLKARQVPVKALEPVKPEESAGPE